MNEYSLQGRRVKWRNRVGRIHRYLGGNFFEVLHTDDQLHRVHRNQLDFLP